MSVFTNIGISTRRGDPTLSGYVENLPDLHAHSALVPVSTTLGQAKHTALTGPIGLLGLGDDRCHPIWFWDAVNGKVVGFDGSTFGNLAAVPHRQEYLDSRRDPDPLNEGADTYGSGTVMLFPFYGNLILVMSVIVPSSKVYVMRYNPDALGWEELSEIEMPGAGPRSVAFSNAVNYRGGVTWMGGDSVIDRMLIFHLTSDLEVEIYPHADPRGWELFKPIVTETAQQLKLMPTIEPHLDSLMSAAAHAYSDRDISQSGVREAAREFLLDHSYLRPLFGLRRVLPDKQMAKAARVDWPFVNPEGMCSLRGRLFFTNTLGQVCRYDERTGKTKVLFDIPWSIAEMQKGTFATENDGSAVEGDFDFRLSNPTPSTTPGFEHDGALPVEYWNSYCRLKIISIPDTGDPGLNAKFATFIGREGIYSGLEDDKHWVLDLTGRPLFSSYLDTGTGLWERLALPAGTVIDTAYAYGGCIDNELNAHAGINLHMMESGGHLYVMAMPALTRQQQGLVTAVVESVSCNGNNLEIVLRPSDYVTPLTVTTASGVVTSGPGASDPAVYSILDNSTTEVTVVFGDLYAAEEIDIEINGLLPGYPNFSINLPAVLGCKPTPTASVASAACTGDVLTIVIDADDAVTPINITSVAGVVVSGPGNSVPGNYTITDNNTPSVTIEFPELDVGDVLDIDFGGTVFVFPLSLSVDGISGCKVIVDPLLFNVGDTGEASPATDTANDHDWIAGPDPLAIDSGYWRTAIAEDSNAYIQKPSSYPPLDVVANGEARIELEGKGGVTCSGLTGIASLMEQLAAPSHAWKFTTDRNGSGDLRLMLWAPATTVAWSVQLIDNHVHINNPFTIGFKAVDIGGGQMRRYWYFNGAQILTNVVALASLNTLRIYGYYTVRFGCPRQHSFRNATNNTSFA